MASVAQAATPAPGYSQFAGCPTATEIPTVTACIRADITGGNFKMGSKNVPLSKPIAITGGWDPVTQNVYPGPGGGMTKVKQLVPGGIIGITGLDWLVNFLSIEGLQLFAVTEIAGQPKSGFTTLTMPVRVHLVNPTLGNNCYVGSFTNPIVLNLQTETTSPPPPNTPITGIPPTFGFDPATETISATGGQFVDNSFAAPGASGCVLTLFGFIPISINGLVNTQSGLPAAAGNNETRQNINLQLAPEERVFP